MKINGTIINYYFHCKRQCYLFANRLNMEDNSEDVRVGRVLHEIKAKDIKQILSIEGKVWAEFYSTFKYFLPEDFMINKRVKRPPDNPMNAMISFGNTLLYTKTISEIYNTHLEQSISFLHEPSEARFSLSLDLSEVFKPVIVYKTIFDLVNNKKIKVEKHFNSKVN